jgi:hypothetical protein
MPKKYTDTLADWVNNPDNANKPRRDRHWVAFLAVKTDVVAAIEAGYALRTIWEHLNQTGRITYCYETFLKHVNKLKKTGWEKRQFEEHPQENNQAPSKSDGFKFNAVPKKEDLF